MGKAKKPVKDKLKGKAKTMKEKIKGKLKGASTVAAVAVLFALAQGCATATPASRATSASYRIDVTVKMCESARCGTLNMPFTFGDGALASADSEGSTETQTATPVVDVKPDIDVEVPVNKSGGGAQSVGSVLGDAAASAINGLMNKGDSQQKAACKDGSCSTGACTDGSCSL